MFYAILSNIPTKVFMIPLIAIHWILFSGSLLLIILSNDPSVLVATNLFLYMGFTVNAIFGDCPLSILEQHHFNTTLIETVNSLVPFNEELNITKSSPMQWIFMAIVFCSTKLFLLLIKQAFHTFLE